MKRGRLATFSRNDSGTSCLGDAQELPGFELRIEFGSASEQILKAAQQPGADLLVVGTRRVELRARRPSRGVIAQILSDVPCPVLTVNQAALKA